MDDAPGVCVFKGAASMDCQSEGHASPGQPFLGWHGVKAALKYYCRADSDKNREHRYGAADGCSAGPILESRTCQIPGPARGLQCLFWRVDSVRFCPEENSMSASLTALSLGVDIGEYPLIGNAMDVRSTTGGLLRAWCGLSNGKGKCRGSDRRRHTDLTRIQ
jgi:hypothetical protein